MGGVALSGAAKEKFGCAVRSSAASGRLFKERFMKKKIAFLLAAAVFAGSCAGSPAEKTVPAAKFTYTALEKSPESLSEEPESAASEKLPETLSEEPESAASEKLPEILSEETEPSVSEDLPETLPEETESAASEDLPENRREDVLAGAEFVPNPEAFSERLAQIYADYGITGLSVALFQDGRIIHTECIGYADVENEIPCTENTRFRCASVSKLISAMVLMTLCDKGVLTPDTVLSEATGIAYDLPESREKIRLWHLLTHTAGLYDTWDYEYGAVTARTPVDELLRDAHTGSVPGTVFGYSNFGAGTAGAVVERLTGQYFYDYADEALFRPLGMDAGYLIDRITDRESCAKLYDLDGEIFDVPNWGRTAEYYNSFGLGNSYYVAQCELIITASDLARLGIALAGDGSVGGVRVLSEESAEQMRRSYFSAPDFEVGLGVRIYDSLVEGRTLYGHPGNALGCITGLYYDPSDGTGIAFLTNRCLPSVDENGFYKALGEAVTAAYGCWFG